jgi:hypothetical protein
LSICGDGFLEAGGKHRDELLDGRLLGVTQGGILADPFLMVIGFASLSVQSWPGLVFTFKQVTSGFRSCHVRTLVE